MKKLLLSLLTMGVVGAGFSQIILFDEDFQDVTDIDVNVNLDDAENEQWMNLDQDEIIDNNGAISDWFWAIGPEHTFIDGTSVALIPLDGVEDAEINGLTFPWLIEDGVEDTNFVFSSVSWLDGYANGNRNWLITPEFDLAGTNCELTFKAGTAQGPRYSDGFSVWIATDNYNDTTAYVELLEVAQCIPPVPSAATTGTDALDLNAGTVFHEDAYIPYNGFDPAFEDMYFHLGGQEYDNASSYRGLLEPYSIDLSAYDGETVRIAFKHDSDDDVSMDLDDILVTADPLSVEENVSDYFAIFPNPVQDDLNIQFTDKFIGTGFYRILNANGQIIAKGAYQGFGNANTERMDVSRLAAGNYTFQVIMNGTNALNAPFIKK